jgi:hypothetical protein
MKFPARRWLSLFLICGCGVAGYTVGSAGTEVRKNVATEVATIFRRPRRLPRERRLEESPFENFKGLIAKDSKESNLWKVVSRLPKEAIPEALKELRAAKLLTATGSSEERRLEEIESALYFHWAETNPQAALADVSTLPGPPDQIAQMKRAALVQSVLAAWMQTDANAAFRAVKDHDDFGYLGRNMLVQTWTAENVFDKLELFPDKNRDLLGWYCVAASKDEAQRNAMLTALTEKIVMEDRDWAYFMLFRAWAQRDFPAAIAEAKKHDHPGLEDQVINDGLSSQPAATMRWAISQNMPPGGSSWDQGYGNWLRSDPADAQRWLDEQAPAWIRSGHTATVASFRARQLNRKRPEQIDNEAAGEKLIDLVDDWKTKDPKAAAKWLETAPDAARILLTGKGADDHE